MERETSPVDGRAGVPAGPLRGHVAYHGYDVVGAPAGTHRGLPSPYLTFVVTLSEPLAMLGPDGLVRRDTVLGGLHDEPVTIVHDGSQRGVHVVIDPLLARRLVGAPAAALSGVDLDGSEVLGAVAHELHERLNAAPDWATRFAALDDVLARRAAAEPPPVRDEVRRAWRLLVPSRRAPRPPSVREVAQEVGWSERHLERRFRAEFGVGPKVAARMGRFDRVRHRLAGRAAAGLPLGLAEIAADGGYTDQAHLTREFGSLAGCSPTRWIAEEVLGLGAGRAAVGNVQDAGASDGARSRP